MRNKTKTKQNDEKCRPQIQNDFFYSLDVSNSAKYLHPELGSTLDGKTGCENEFKLKQNVWDYKTNWDKFVFDRHIN